MARPPPWIVNSLVKVISSFGLGRAACECKRSCVFVKLGITRESAFRSEVASLVVGVILVGLTSVVFYGTDEVLATTEHISTLSNLARNKLIAGVDGCESGAAIEYIPHIRHLRCIEVAEVERGERGAVKEHTVHIRHLLGVKILNAFYCGQIRADSEPVITARWSCIGKRSIEDHLLDFFFLVKPLRIALPLIKLISSCGHGNSASECKRSCAFVKLGIRMESAFRSEVAIHQVGVIFVVGIGFVVCYGTDEVLATIEHINTRSNQVRNKLIAGEDGRES